MGNRRSMRSFAASLVALAVAAASCVLAVSIARPASAAGFPDGFSESVVGATPSPTSVTALPDGRLLVTAQTGTIFMSDGVTVSPTPVVSLGVCSSSERGLLGLAVDPDFATNGWLYLYRTVSVSGTCVNRLARFTMSGSTVSAASELILIDNIASIGGNHNGGDVQIGADGLLYIGVGDSGCNPRATGNCAAANSAAQDLSLLNGKILRVGRDGSIPADNPFAGDVRCSLTGRTNPGSRCAEIFAYGLRNPFRLAADPNTTQTSFYVNDVGQDTWEEIDQLSNGGNFGWNQREAGCVTGSTTNCGAAPAGLINPVASYPHGGETCPAGTGESITAGAFVPNGAWAGYDGAYLYGDFVCGWIYALSPGGSKQLVSAGVGGIVDMGFVRQNGQWALYYTTYSNGGELHRVLGPGSVTTVVGTGRFVPVTPTRILDTRNGTGYTGTKPAARSTLTVQVTGSVVPSGAIAVALNLTGTESNGLGFVRVWPAGDATPATSNVNFSAAGETVANAAAVVLPPSGALNIFTQPSAHLVGDVTGYWLPATSATDGRFTAVPPSRLLDTRDGTGAPAGLVGAYGQVDLQVTGRGGVPATGVSAVALMVTVTQSFASGFVTVWPTGTALPTASTVNPDKAGDIRTNLVLVPVGAGGKVSLLTKAPTHLVVDVAGWFTTGGAASSSAGLFQPQPPARVLDSRITGSPLLPGVPLAPAVLQSEQPAALLYNLTATDTFGGGFITAYPTGSPLPLASNVNFDLAGQSRAALAITASSTGVSLYSNVGTQYLVDVAGSFT